MSVKQSNVSSSLTIPTQRLVIYNTYFNIIHKLK
nr:MAG TPA: hypothetical protein [Crassvirales sp.]